MKNIRDIANSAIFKSTVTSITCGILFCSSASILYIVLERIRAFETSPEHYISWILVPSIIITMIGVGVFYTHFYEKVSSSFERYN